MGSARVAFYVHLGAEGMSFSGTQEATWGGSIGHTAQEIADLAIELYNDQDKWNQAQQVCLAFQFAASQ